MIVLVKGVDGAQLQHVVVVSGVVGGRQSRWHLSAGARTTRIERLQLRLTALPAAAPHHITVVSRKMLVEHTRSPRRHVSVMDRACSLGV